MDCNSGDDKNTLILQLLVINRRHQHSRSWRCADFYCARLYNGVVVFDCTTALLCSRLYNVHSDHCCILLAGGSVCAHPDGVALIWELGRLLLRLRTHNGGHQIGTQYVRDTGSLTWEFRRKMLLRFRKHNGLFLDFYR